MNTATILQVPVSKTLRDRAAKAAEDSGFSSLQEAVRVFLSQFAARNLHVTFSPSPIRLSPKNDKRYEKMMEEIEKGIVEPFTAHSTEDLMGHLNDKNS